MSPHNASVVEMIRAFHPVEMLETLSPGVLTVACTGERPTDYVEGGKIMGIHGEVRRRVAEILGLETRAVKMDFARMIPALDAGEIDLPGIGTAWTPDRAEVFKLTQPFQYFYFGVASHATEEPVSLPLVASQHITTLTGSFNNDEVAGAVAENGGSLVLRDDIAGVIDDLQSGAAEVAIYDHPNIAIAVAEADGLPDFRVQRLSFDRRYPLTTGRVPCHLVMRGSAHRLSAGAMLAIDFLRATGELSAIYGSYAMPDELLDMAPVSAS
jgi:ABC-type amino acid transport substrate-binding protein